MSLYVNELGAFAFLCKTDKEEVEMNQERKRILELVQKGKLSAQEAIILLEALDEAGEKTDATINEAEQTNTPINEAEQTKEAEPKQTETPNDEVFQGTRTEEKQEEEKNEQGRYLLFPIGKCWGENF